MKDHGLLSISLSVAFLVFVLAYPPVYADKSHSHFGPPKVLDGGPVLLASSPSQAAGAESESSTKSGTGSAQDTVGKSKSNGTSRTGRLIYEKAKVDRTIPVQRTSKYLKVIVVHDEKLPPLPPGLCVGSVFNEYQLSKLTGDKENRWYQIPDWLKGEYSYSAMDTYLYHNYKTGRDRKNLGTEPALQSGRYRGLFRDSKGGIWQRIYGGLVGGSDPDTYRIDDELIGDIIDADHYVESSSGVQFGINPGLRIEYVIRNERIRNYSHQRDGQVLVQTTEKAFDEKGNPVDIEYCRGTMIKRDGFEELKPGESFESQSYDELVRAFCKFLKGRDTPDLIPDAFKNIATD